MARALSQRRFLSVKPGDRYGDIRYRIDDQQSSTNAADNIELTAGLSWAW
jgi:hypothetical protein